MLKSSTRVKETGEELLIATTRPELMSSCQLVIVNPEDESYKKLHGLHAVVPIFEREVEIRPHPSAKREKGTGAVMICSYGDYHDVTLFRELGLREIISIDERGRMTEAAGQFRDLTVEEARRKVVEELTARGQVRRTLTITHEVPTCERSGDPIEIIPMREFYLKQLDFIPQVLSALAGPTSIQEMRFLQPRRIHGRNKNSRHLDGFSHLTTLQLQIRRKEQTILSANLPGHDSASG